MNLEKIWNHPSSQQNKKQIEEDILESQDSDSFIGEASVNNEDLNMEQCGDSWVKFNDTNDILKEVSKEDIYSWYSVAMARRNREPLHEDSFDYHFSVVKLLKKKFFTILTQR